jgi:hypothetical protein
MEVVLIALIVAAALIGLIRPVWGIAIFLFGETGFRNVLINGGLVSPTMGPFQIEITALLGAMAALWSRAPQKYSKTGLLGAMVWSLSVLTLLSRGFEIGVLNTRILSEVVLACLWGPLLHALLRLDEDEWSDCAQVMVVTAGATALLALLITFSGSQQLYQWLATRSEDLQETGFIGGRIQVHGLWAFMPFGLWISLEQLYAGESVSRSRRMINLISTTLILGAIAVNLTRALLLGVVVGGAVLVVGLRSVSRLHRRRARAIGACIAVGLMIGLVSPQLREAWTARATELRKSGVEDGRYVRNEHVLEMLLDQPRLFGQKDFWATEAQISRITGDPYTALTIWGNYGTVAMVVFVAFIVLLGVRLLRMLPARSGIPPDLRAHAWFLVAWYAAFHLYMVGGNYMLEVTTFALVYLVAETIRLECAAHAVRATAAPAVRYRRIARPTAIPLTGSLPPR